MCTKNTAQVGVSRDRGVFYSTKQRQVLYLSQDMPPSTVFFVHMSLGGGIVNNKLVD